MNPNEVTELFERYGVLHSGHFKLSSGRHSDTYLQCARILEHPRVAASLGEAIAKRYPDGADVVVSPALGGILIGNAVAYAIGCRFLFAERVDGAMALRRGQRVGPGERVLVVEDVITTGGSAAEVIDLCERAGATVLGVGALVDRTEGPPPFHLEALLRIHARTWEPSTCPLCARGEPLHTPGSRGLSRADPGKSPSP
jgi:orotate phosphoribosyltransferase